MSKTKFWCIVFLFLIVQVLVGYFISPYFPNAGAMISLSGAITIVWLIPVSLLSVLVWSK